MSNQSNTVVMVLLIILSIDVVFFLSQEAVNNINPDGIQFSNSHIITDYGSNYTINPDDVSLAFPDTEGSINPETGNIFTDGFTAVKTWFSDTSGLTYLKNFVGAPVMFLSGLGLPQAFTFSISALWYGLTLFTLIAFALGRL